MFEVLKKIFRPPSEEDLELDVEKAYASQISLMKFVVAVLIAIIALMVIVVKNVSVNHESKVDLPPNLYTHGTIKVGNGWGNELFFRVWADWFVRDTATFTPGDIHSKLDLALRFFPEEKLDKYTGNFGNLNNIVIRNGIHQTFAVKDIKPTFYSDTEFQEIASDEQIVAAKYEYFGVASQIINNKAMPDRQCKYVVSIVMDGDHLYGNTYDTDCFK